MFVVSHIRKVIYAPDVFIDWWENTKDLKGKIYSINAVCHGSIGNVFLLDDDGKELSDSAVLSSIQKNEMDILKAIINEDYRIDNISKARYIWKKKPNFSAWFEKDIYLRKRDVSITPVDESIYYLSPIRVPKSRVAQEGHVTNFTFTNDEAKEILKEVYYMFEKEVY